MNKYILLVFLMFLIFTVKAQPLPGKYILKGSSELTGQFLTTDYKSGSNSVQVETSQINFQPSVGVFISHYIYLGIYTGYKYQKETEGDSYNKSKEFLIGPYVRGYFGDFKFIPFVQGNLGYSNNKLEQKDDISGDVSDLKLDGINYGLGVGVEYFNERKFTFEFMINYSGTSVSKTENTTNFYTPSATEYKINSRGFGFRIGTSIFLN